jgi:hypothetical protein
VRRFATILILLLASLPAHAGTIEPNFICEAYQAKDNVSIFRGRVLDLSTDPESDFDMARMQPLEVFKGRPGREITIIPRTAFGDLLIKGHEYLIIANAPNHKNTVAANVQEMKNVDPARLAWLRAYSTAPKTVRIFGEFSSTLSLPLSAPRTSHPIVTLAGRNNRTWTITPDDKSAYSFNDIPPGTYTVSASVPSGLVAMTEQGWNSELFPHVSTSPLPKINQTTVTVAPKGCARVKFILRTDNHIKGRVTDTAGHPVASIGLGLIPRGGKTELMLASGQDSIFSGGGITSEDGTYNIAGIAPGDYSIVLHYNTHNNKTSYPPVFYPAHSRLSDAAILHIDTSTTLEGIDFIRPDALPPATVHVLVVRKDGSPIDRASIRVNASAYTMQDAVSVKTDATGHADLPLFAGREYNLTAVTPEPDSILVPSTDTQPQTVAPTKTPQAQPVCAGPVEFIATDGLALPPLTPDKTLQACLYARRPPLTPAP